MFAMFTKVREATAAGVEKLAPRRPFRSSTSLKMAVVAMLLGLAMWIMRSGKAEEASAPGTNGTPSSGFAQPSTSKDGALASKSRRLVPTSPALFRFGASFLGGFILGFAGRRFLRVTAIVAGVVLAGIGLMKITGVIDLDWAAIEQHTRESLEWTNGKVAGLKTLLTGYLPSAVAGFLGIVRGLWWK